jgi:hypothetical protein
LGRACRGPFFCGNRFFRKGRALSQRLLREPPLARWRTQRMKPCLVVVLLAGLAACSGGPRIVGAPPPGIAYRLDGAATDAFDQRAEQYCQNYGKHAKLQSVERSGDASVAEYSCR